MMKRIAQMTALATLLVVTPALGQDTPTPPTTPPAKSAPPRPPAPPPLPKLPDLARPPSDTPPSTPLPGESQADAARRIRREARDTARKALREAERKVRDAERAAEDAERRLDEQEEDAQDDDGEDGDDEDEEDNGGPQLRVGSRGERQMVIVGQDVHVPAGQVVQSAVSVGGSVFIEPGAVVEEDAVAVGGDVEVADGGVVRGDAVSIGGSIHTGAGSVVGGNRVNLAPGAHFLTNVLHHDRGAAAWSFISTIISIVRILVLFALATLIIVLVPERVTIMRGFVEERPFVSALAGVASLAAIVPLCILLVVTLVGIPLAPVAVVAFLLTLVVGFAVVAVWIGERLPVLKDKKTMFAALAIGFAVLTLIDLLLPIAGTFLVFCASLVGAGAVLLSRFGQVRAVGGAPPAGTALTRTP